MKKLLIIALLASLSGCSNFDASDTIAGGKNGTIDYCIELLGNKFVCVNAKRKGEDKDG